MKQFYIIDSTHNKFSIDKINTCEVASKLRLYCGSNYSEEDIKRLWNHNSNYPSFDKIRKNIRITNIKWYIYTHTKELIRDLSWNPDFLMGMLQWGKINYYPKNFPSFIWLGNFDLSIAINCSPFAGRLSAKFKTDNRYFWSSVPALCLKFSSNTIEYLAGILSTGIIVTYKNKVLASYNNKVGGIVKALGIPIEYSNKRFVFISPFWAVILQDYMPQPLKDKWNFIYHAYRASEYSSILWKIYTGKDPMSDAMPYLLSRRTIFYKYGSIRALRELWIKNQLVELDSRFKKVVQEWQKKVV